MTSRINVAIVGVGNCASSFIQGIEYYRYEPVTTGLGRPIIGGYEVGDIHPVIGFDVHPEKVGRSLDKAIFAGPNNAEFFCEPDTDGAKVYSSPVMDGAAGLADWFDPVTDSNDGDEIVRLLREHEVDVVVNWLPVGSSAASQWWARTVLDAGCAFVNAIPVPIAARPGYQQLYADANLPLIGDDIKSQIGATIIHRALAEIFERRGGSGSLRRTYQLNVGGNGDFKNMHSGEDRLVDKRASKTGAVTSIADLSDDNVHIGPSDFVPWLQDTKVALMRLEGVNFGNRPMDVDIRLSVQDSPNAAGVVVDAVRIAKVAMNRGQGGANPVWSAPLFKSPPVQSDDVLADRALDAWLAE